MSIAITIRAEEMDSVLASVDALGNSATLDQVKKVMGREMQQIIKAHFERLAGDNEHHQTAENLGGQRTGFYERAALQVNPAQIESDGVSVSVEFEGLAQRLFGGIIDARPGGFLTIPARAETYGHRAREFSNLMMIIFPSGAGALVAKPEGHVTGGKGGKRRTVPAIDKFGSDVFYWLVKSVTQPPDPTVLPTDEEILDPVIASAQSFIASLWGAGQ
jgi:hypothetical protein